MRSLGCMRVDLANQQLLTVIQTADRLGFESHFPKLMCFSPVRQSSGFGYVIIFKPSDYYHNVAWASTESQEITIGRVGRTSLGTGMYTFGHNFMPIWL